MDSENHLLGNHNGTRGSFWVDLFSILHESTNFASFTDWKSGYVNLRGKLRGESVFRDDLLRMQKDKKE